MADITPDEQGQGYGEVPQDSDSETVTIEDRVTTLELAVAELGEMGGIVNG